MKDKFFSQNHCDRCGGDLKNGRIMSMFNTECLYMKCSSKEKLDKDYKKAVQADHEQIRQGNYNFEGIRGQREMHKAFFTRKAVDIDELKRRTGQEQDKCYFVVEKVIELSKEKFNAFAKYILSYFEFIKENVDLMYIDNSRIWHCILIKAEGSKDGILVESEGYGYARYSGYCPDCKAVI